MTILIFGVTGQDGGFLAERLIKEGMSVHGTSRSLSNLRNLKRLKIENKIQIHKCNTANKLHIDKIINHLKPKEIYNLGGQTSVGQSFLKPVLTYELNTLSTIYMLESIRKAKFETKFYNAGSSEIFGNTLKKGANEESLYKPLSPYALSKAHSIDLVKFYRDTYGMFAVSGILFNHESHLRGNNFVTQKIISSAAKIKNGTLNKLELGNLQVWRDWGWAPEFVEAMTLMMKTNEPQDFVIGTGKATLLENFVQSVFDFFDLNWENFVHINKDFYRPSDISFSKADPSKANDILNWKSNTSIEEIITKMCEFKVSNKYLD